MTGTKETVNPDGLATGSLTINDLTGDFSGDLFSDIAAPTAMHIHGPLGFSGANIDAFVNLGVVTRGRPGSLNSAGDDERYGRVVGHDHARRILREPHNSEVLAGAVCGQLLLEPAGIARALVEMPGWRVLHRTNG